jgi:ketosteroid isomerase-like protein
MTASRPADFIGRVGERCTWTVAGTSGMAGTYEGREAILDFFRRTQELTDGTYAVELNWELDDGDRQVTYYRARGRRPDGRELDLDQALVCRLDEEGCWLEVRALPYDHAVFDAFWS